MPQGWWGWSPTQCPRGHLRIGKTIIQLTLLRLSENMQLVACCGARCCCDKYRNVSRTAKPTDAVLEHRLVQHGDQSDQWSKLNFDEAVKWAIQVCRHLQRMQMLSHTSSLSSNTFLLDFHTPEDRNKAAGTIKSIEIEQDVTTQSMYSNRAESTQMRGHTEGRVQIPFFLYTRWVSKRDELDRMRISRGISSPALVSRIP